jgi:hypothetical protein
MHVSGLRLQELAPHYFRHIKCSERSGKPFLMPPALGSLAASDPSDYGLPAERIGGKTRSQESARWAGGLSTHRGPESCTAMATAQLTRAMGGLSVSGSRPTSAPAAPSFGFCACMRGQSLIGAHFVTTPGALRCLLLKCPPCERPSFHTSYLCLRSAPPGLQGGRLGRASLSIPGTLLPFARLAAVSRPAAV